MKKRWYCVFVIGMFFSSSGKAMAQDPITLIIKEGIKKVIVAVDLQIQRLQNETIWLQNAQKAVENTMSKVQLEEIAGWVEKQRVLYEDYFEELWKVKATLAYYHRIRDMTDLQKKLVREYSRVWKGISQDKHFTAEEKLYMGQVYTRIIEASLQDLEGLALVIHSFTVQMNDADRLHLIQQTADALEGRYRDLRIFNDQNIRLSLQRAQNAQQLSVVKQLYGITP